MQRVDRKLLIGLLVLASTYGNLQTAPNNTHLHTRRGARVRTRSSKTVIVSREEGGEAQKQVLQLAWQPKRFGLFTRRRTSRSTFTYLSKRVTWLRESVYVGEVRGSL